MIYWMKKISLKWHIFFFFIILGFIPMMVITYFAIVSYSRSINSLTDEYVSKIVQRIAEQTASQGEIYFKYLNILAKYPFVQLSFHQYPDARHLETTREKLELFRTNTESFDRINLFANDGHLVISTSTGSIGINDTNNAESDILLANQHNHHHRVKWTDKTPVIIFYKRVYDFRRPDRPVGIVTAEVGLKKLLTFTRQLSLGTGIQKTITNNKGLVIYQEASLKEKYFGVKKEFSTHIPFLDWNIKILIPEKQLFADVNQLTHRILAFTFFIALVAIAASFAIGHVAIKPLLRIINGTREFASGNLDYRIEDNYGFETRQVAKAFNTMADELQKRQAEIIQADKLASIGLLSAGFAHDVRNPLAGIKTSAQVLIKQSRTKEVKKLAKGISTEVDRLNKIVTDLLYFSRPQTSKKKSCDLVDIINQSLEILNYEVCKKKVKIINRVARHTVFIAPEQMIQIMINLLLNAFAAVEPEKGIITITSKISSANKLVLQLMDNGCGISQEQLPLIFDPFFSMSKEGTGIGLCVVHLLLCNNNIDIDVKSVEEEGTTFLLIFNNHSPLSLEV